MVEPLETKERNDEHNKAIYVPKYFGPKISVLPFLGWSAAVTTALR